MKNFILPSEIPWPEMKGELLEQFVYWLLDDMGAKDLEWRRGGTKSTSADKGRDLEASFYASSPDGEMSKERWWVQVKGRSSTVEAAALKEFVVTAKATANLDVLVIATNTQFSNPTRDWVKDWEKNNPRPRIRLWDRDALERLAMQHPSVIARQHPEALSPQGLLEAVSSRFWNQMRLPSRESLLKVWEQKDNLDFTPESIAALVAGDVSANSIEIRPWLRSLDGSRLFEIAALVLGNFPYLLYRAESLGVQQESITKFVSYVMSSCLTYLPFPAMRPLLEDPLLARGTLETPVEITEIISTWIADAVERDLAPSCSNDCVRISADDDRPVKHLFWIQIKGVEGNAVNKETRLILERCNEPCNAGLKLNTKARCPLYTARPKTPLARIQVYSQILRNRMQQQT